ncbi:MAG TPA: DUF3471 domain-containing protein, partial [Longimicrobiaceae bacterium]|nr:DUF3471 domain-containing protein [Longimicrobiaceae bacterium]
VVLANGDHAELRHALMYRALDLAAGDSTRDWSADELKVYAPARARAAAAARAIDSARVRGTRPALPLAAYAGTYADPDSLYGRVTIALEGGRLVARGSGSWVGDLEHWHYETFRARWRDHVLGRSMLTFALDAAGKPASVDVEGFTRFVRVPPPPTP